MTVPAGATSAKFTIATVIVRINDHYNGDLQRRGQDRSPDVRLPDCGGIDLHSEPSDRRQHHHLYSYPERDHARRPRPCGFCRTSRSSRLLRHRNRSGRRNEHELLLTTTLVPDPIVAHISANALATATVTTPLTINLTNRGRKWVLNNVAFKDGGTATGYFTYDAATAKYLDGISSRRPDPIRTIRWASLP